MQSKATTVSDYLAELDQDHRTQIAALRKHIKKHLQKGFEETMAWGMICYQVPMKVSGPTYNKQPLVYVGLASQKNHISLYLMSVYASPQLIKQFEDQWLASGKKLNKGKGCVRFKNIDSADLAAIAMVVQRCTPEQFVEEYLSATNRAK